MDEPDPDPEAARRREAMAQAVLRHGAYLDARVLRALEAVPREAFVPPERAGDAFADQALEIGHGQTISAPHMVAIMCSVLDPRPGDRVLEVGTGSGYHAAVLAHLVRPRGQVIGIEVIPTLAERAAAALRQAGYPEVEVRVGDGAEGAPDAAPFDRISVAAATPEIPQAWRDQLAVGGRLVVPVGRRECVLTSVDREADGFRERTHGLCVFVPLVRPNGA